MRTVLVLDNIRSVYNVGSIFRTADAAGVEKIFLVGTTPAPIDRFGRKRRDFAKVSLGSEEVVLWEQVLDAHDCIERLRASAFSIVSLEQDPRAVPYTSYVRAGDVALVLGNEVGGVSEYIRNASDAIIEIPMHGTKESLNVSVAAGVALFYLRPR